MAVRPEQTALQRSSLAAHWPLEQRVGVAGGHGQVAAAATRSRLLSDAMQEPSQQRMPSHLVMLLHCFSDSTQVRVAVQR
jgi:hypothetical protein